MARSNIQVSAGSGTKLATNNYTDGADSKHDEVMVLGEQFLPSYTVLTAAGTTATANSHLLQIMAGASLKVRIRRIEVHQMGMATTAAMCQFDLVRLTTAGTGGGVLTPASLDTGDGATSGATAMSLPTAKGTEPGINIARSAAYMMQTLGASAEKTNPIIVWDFDRPRSKPLLIQAGVTLGIAIKNVTAIAGATVICLVWFDEVAY